MALHDGELGEARPSRADWARGVASDCPPPRAWGMPPAGRGAALHGPAANRPIFPCPAHGARRGAGDDRTRRRGRGTGRAIGRPLPPLPNLPGSAAPSRWRTRGAATADVAVAICVLAVVRGAGAQHCGTLTQSQFCREDCGSCGAAPCCILEVRVRPCRAEAVRQRLLAAAHRARRRRS
jgi:hypothetical protein